jgi:hypothetical protein
MIQSAMPIVHPRPTESIAKELYGLALGCAFPECSEPLFRDIPGQSDRQLNSRIAHICARSEGGPRWDPNMSREDNRAAPNLLLLCLKHADEIDSPDLVASYPIEVLQRWKEDQLTASATAVRSWQITDDEAAEVIEKSFPPTTIAVQGETIIVGGMGGNFGGGGGGGGAIGPGALGGPGGNVGYIDLHGKPGVEAGAGGGGGGTVAPDAITPDPAQPQPTDGAGFSSGLDGGDGGDTVVSMGGTELLRAAGGGGGLGGTGQRLQSEALSVSSMLFVRFGEIAPSGLVSILSGAWQSTSILNLGDGVGVSLFVVFEAAGVAVGEYTGSVAAYDPDGVERHRVRFPITVTQAGDILRIPRFCELRFPATKFGLWTFIVAHNRDLGSLQLLLKRSGQAEPQH